MGKEEIGRVCALCVARDPVGLRLCIGTRRRIHYNISNNNNNIDNDNNSGCTSVA